MGQNWIVLLVPGESWSLYAAHGLQPLDSRGVIKESYSSKCLEFVSRGGQ